MVSINIMLPVFTLVTVALTLHGFATAFEIKDCTSGTTADARLKNVAISMCPDKSGPHCRLVRGKNATIDVDFDTTSEFKSADVKITAKLGPFKIPFKINPSEACGNYGFNCPVGVNQSERLEITLPILKTYQPVSLVIQLKMVDEHQKPIVCVEFPAAVTNN